MALWFVKVFDDQREGEYKCTFLSYKKKKKRKNLLKVFSVRLLMNTKTESTNCENTVPYIQRVKQNYILRLRRLDVFLQMRNQMRRSAAQ